MQLVDPFVPVTSKQPPAPQKAAPEPSVAFVHPRQAVTSEVKPSQPLPAPKPAPVSQPRPAPPRRSKRFRSLLVNGVIIIVAVGLGLSIRSLIVGQIAIAVYAVLALVFRVSSRTTFLLAVLSLGVVLVSTVRSDSGLAGTFAAHAFLLLVVGTVCLAREVRDEI